MTTTLHLTLLGKPEIRLNGTPPTKFKYQKSLALLAYLAVTGRPHSREALAGLLWGETTEANARAGLRKSLSELRGMVGEHLIIEHQQLAFNFNTTYHLDVENFQTQIERYQGRANSDLDPQQACALVEALEAYQGDFLSDFHVRNAVSFEEWATIRRECFRMDALRGLHMLADHYLTQGDYPQAIHHIEKLLALEPTQEEAHRQKMSLLALDGQRDAALRQYATCRGLLRTTLHIEPQAETTALYERIRAQDPQQIPDQRLPVPLNPLIGRQNEIDEIESRLRDPDCRLLTILGPGGSGKTHLALEVGSRYPLADVSISSAGVTFVPLNSLRNLSALPAALMHGLGFHFDKDAPPIQQLQEQLADQSRLIILDNFEHLLAPPPLPSPPIIKEQQAKRSFPRPEGNAVEAARPENTAPSTTVQRASDFRSGSLEILTHLLQAAPQLKILITSRVRLNIQGEHILPLSGIAYPPNNHESGAATSAFPAVELFIQRARQIDPYFEPDPTTQEQIASICQQVAGLPLGILLAAGWSGLLSPAEIAERLAADQGGADNGSDFLAADSGDLPDRHRSLRAVFAYSWNLLTPQEQAALAALSIFPGGFTLEAAQEIGAAGLNELRSLVDHSLVQRETSGRYRLHEVPRQFAKQKITDRAGLQSSYCTYYAAHLAAWGVEIQGASQLEAIAALDMEIDNARQAWRWAIEQGNLVVIDQCMDGLCLYYDFRSRYLEGYTACEELIRHLDNAETMPNGWHQAETQRVHAKILIWQSFFAPTKDAESILRSAWASLDHPITKEIDTRAERAFCLLRLAKNPSRTYDQAAAQEMFAQSIKLYVEFGDRWGLANVLTSQGELLWELSAYEEASINLQKGLDIYRALGDLRGMSTAMVWLGTLASFQGQPEGEELIRESLALSADVGNQVSMTAGFYQAIGALILMGRFDEAHSLLEEKNALDKGFGFRQDMTHIMLADTLLSLGRYEEARPHIQTGLKLARRFADSFALGLALIVSGWMALVDEEYETARNFLQESAAHCQIHDLKELLSWALAFQGLTDWQLEQPKEAAKNFKQALLMAIEIESYAGVGLALISGIPMIAARTSKELALTCYTALSLYPAVSNAQSFTDLIGGHIEAIKAELPPKKVARAEANGKKWDLEKIIRKILIRV